jgi:hypothetical protein
MNPDAILEKVCRSIDVLIQAGARYEGLFPSLIDLETHEMLRELPPPIEGQRQGDRALLGSNLMHDQTVLKTMYGLSRALGRKEYQEAADGYLERFATHCTETVTGLFPWGEHSYWHLEEDRVGNSFDPSRKGSAIHDHLRQAPVWLWEKLYEQNPRCAERFAEGLDYHYQEGEPTEYIRHAHIEAKKRIGRGARSCDFPRHGGFYILDWSFAYSRTGRADFLQQIDRMTDYWWSWRDEKNLLLSESRTPEDDVKFFGINSTAQTLSLGVSLLEAATLLDDEAPERADVMRQRAGAYIDGFLAAPHDLVRGVYVNTCKRRTDEVESTSPIWGSVYGLWPASYTALICLCAYRLTENERLLKWAEAAGSGYLNEPFPEDVAVPAMDAGLGLELTVDLYDLTESTAWLEGALALAEKLMGIYVGGDLLRTAAGITWYESQMQPGDVLHGLSRLALLAQDREACPLDPNYTAR